MAHPIGFSQANQILGRPPSMTAAECSSLEVYRDEKMTISKWQLSDEELEELKRNGGKLFVSVLGTLHPPILPSPLDPFR